MRRQTVRQILGICFFSVFMLWTFCFPANSGPFWELIFNILTPFVFGFSIAYLLNLVMRRLERIPRKKGSMPRSVSLLLSVIFFLGLIGLVVGLIIPRLVSAVSAIVQSLPEVYEEIRQWLLEVLKPYPDMAAAVQGADMDWNNITQSAGDMLQENAVGILGGVVSIAGSTVRLITNLLMGFFLAMIVLPSKERFAQGIREMLQKHMKPEKAEKLFSRTALLDEKFRHYFESQFIEAVAMGISVWLMMLIIGIPFGAELGVFNGVMYLIPSIGTPIAMLLGAVLVFAIEPIKALWYLLVVLGVQILIQSFVHPPLIQKKVNLPGYVEFISVLLFGTNFGVPGVIVSIPLTAWLYDLYWKKYDHLEPAAKSPSPAETGKLITPQEQEKEKNP